MLWVPDIYTIFNINTYFTWKRPKLRKNICRSYKHLLWPGIRTCNFTTAAAYPTTTHWYYLLPNQDQVLFCIVLFQFPYKTFKCVKHSDRREHSSNSCSLGIQCRQRCSPHTHAAIDHPHSKCLTSSETTEGMPENSIRIPITSSNCGGGKCYKIQNAFSMTEGRRWDIFLTNFRGFKTKI